MLRGGGEPFLLIPSSVALCGTLGRQGCLASSLGWDGDGLLGELVL